MKIRIATLSLTILCLALSAPAFAGQIYNDGPTLGTYNSLFIDGPGGTYGQTISDGFFAGSCPGCVGGQPSFIDFAEWTAGGAPTTVTWSLGDTSFGTNFGTNTATGSDLSSNFLFTNGYGYSVYDTHIVTHDTHNLSSGSFYYLTLGGANDQSGNGLDAWDINNGSALCYFAQRGIQYGGCGYGGESFTISGGQPTTPEPSSILLFGSGILGLAGVLRRKLTR